MSNVIYRSSIFLLTDYGKIDDFIFSIVFLIEKKFIEIELNASIIYIILFKLFLHKKNNIM